MGGFSEGGGVRVNCLLGVNTGAVVLLPLLSGFFPFLLFVGAVVAVVALLGRGAVSENFEIFFTPAVGLEGSRCGRHF
jgi:hypothetical protein